MRFSIGDAWADTMRMIIDRPLVIFGTALLFMVLQYLPMGAIFGLFFASMDPTTGLDPEADPFAAAGIGLGLIFGMFVAYLLILVIAVFGQMVMMVLLHNRSGTSFGSAWGDAMRAMPGMLLLMVVGIVAYFMISMVLVLVMGIGIAAATAASEAAGIGIAVIFGLIFFCAFLYLFSRLSLTMPAMVLAGIRNPFTALGKSWNLTGAAPWKLILFYIVLVAVFVVVYVAALASMEVVTQSLVAGAMEPGETTGGIAGIIGVFVFFVVIGLIVSVLTVSCVTAAYRQLSDDEEAGLTETFG